MRRRALRPAATAVAPPPPDLLFLDLDGVLVDSAGELSASAYDAAVERWPAAMAATPREAVLAGMARGRPRVIAGFEALVMARLMAQAGGGEAGAAAVLAGDWPGQTVPGLLASWNESADDLASFFEAHRTAAAKDEAAWLARNAPYPGVAAALAGTAMPWYVVSSKSGARVALLMRGCLGQGAGFEVGGPRVRAGLQPPDVAKPAAIAELAARAWGGGPGPGRPTLHFVDDRYETLRAVAADARLKDAVARRALRLYHASWGYATDEERAAAAADAAVTPLTLDGFCEFLRWGLVMGVDDGCEPTAAEVEEGVK